MIKFEKKTNYLKIKIIYFTIKYKITIKNNNLINKQNNKYKINFLI